MKPYTGLNEKKKIQNECVTFYNKSIDIFTGNVQDKLRSLVDNIDFSQLWSKSYKKYLIQHGSRSIKSQIPPNNPYHQPTTCPSSSNKAKCSVTSWVSEHFDPGWKWMELGSGQK